ncbi:MAG: DEAD/DEAH box helicase family protein, partial [Rectinemataceae bacterium]
LSHKGWERAVINYPTEKNLLKNWATILFDNNRDIDRLGDYPLTEGEMRQIMEQIAALRTPLKLNGFINGKTVSITRDNPEDRLHFGKEVSLKIYDRREIAAGQSRYQIARQPQFKSRSKILSERRGDLMLLINGMPVIHIELKKSGAPVSQAFHQIEKYSDEGIFTSLFSLVQIFVAMQPEETRYFANPGPEGRFNPDYYFRWADFNNEPINDWKDIASSLLSIPMAHQLIANSKDADKVIFLMDRIELGTQSLNEYRGFAEESEEVQATENTAILITKLKSTRPADTLIVTSIQKMSNIKNEEGGINAHDLALMQAKRIVIIVDEAHRSTFGDMLITIKATFPRALLFGFTGTPIHEENQKKLNTTSTLFGDELHRYSIADGIRDKNVLGFDPYKVLTYRDKDLRVAVALEQAKASDETEAFADPKRKAVFNRFMKDTPMAGYIADDGLVEIIEDYNARYGQDFSLPTHAQFKKDIATRLAHKDPYLRLERSPEKQIDLLIVVDQMLTGFDSLWINTLYMDRRSSSIPGTGRSGCSWIGLIPTCAQ